MADFGERWPKPGPQRIGQPSAFGGLREGFGDATAPQYVGSWSSQPSAAFASGDDNQVYGPGSTVQRRVNETPIIDLRGDLKDMSGFSSDAARLQEGALLFSTFTFSALITATLATSGFWRFFFVTKSHPTNPTFAAFDSTRIDISSQVYGGATPGTAGGFDVYTSLITFPIVRPTRYWGCAVVADCVQGTVGESGIVWTAGVY